MALDDMVKISQSLFASGLKTASDLSLVKAAGISHLINLSRAAANCAEDVADPSNKHDFKEAKETGLWSLRCTVFGLKGEPYRDIFRRLGVLVAKVLAQGGRVLVHGATNEVEVRVFAVCSALLMVAEPDTCLRGAISRITKVQREVAKHAAWPCGLPNWHLKALFEFAGEREHVSQGDSLEQLLSDFEHPNTPQEVLETFAWRCGSSSASAGNGPLKADTDNQPHSEGEHVAVAEYPVLYGQERHAVWYGGHCMVVETVCGDPRIAFVHNLVTPEEAEELKARAQDVGLKQSRVGGTNYWSRFQDLPKEVVQEDAIRNGRTSTSCRVDRTLPVSAAVVLRVSHLVGMSPYCSEAVQVVHYEEGQEYQVHNDWFSPGDPFYDDRMRLRGQRLISCFCYLCDVPEGLGGGTFFPELKLRFHPRTGCAALWWNRTHDTKEMDERVVHCGEKPTRGAEKWGLNVWVREFAGTGPVYRRDSMGRVITEDGLLRFVKQAAVPA